MLSRPEITSLARKIFEELRVSRLDRIDLNEESYSRILLTGVLPTSYDALEILDVVVSKVERYFIKLENNNEAAGITGEYVRSKTESGVLVRPREILKEKPFLKFLWGIRHEIQTAIQSMHWESFEILSKELLKSSGVSKIEPTKRGTEGIDFCGIYEFNLNPHSLIPPKFDARIVGQVKRRSDRKIIPQEVRAFSTYFDNVKNHDEDVMKPLPEWFKKRRTRVLGIYITATDYTRGASRFSANEWLFLRTGAHVVECLIRSPFAGNWVKKTKRGLTFNKNAFLETFAGLR